MKGSPMFFFNNCRGRNYLNHYGMADAFYDLYMTGWQANKAPTFRRGDECIVATTMKDGQIGFTRFRLERVEELLDKQEDRNRVFCGPATQSETLSKDDAAHHNQYSVLFDKNGNFKQQSVLER